MTASTFVWIDHSEKQRRQVLEAVDQFREEDTRDERGTAGIRDVFSVMLFPGTGAVALGLGSENGAFR